jgi:hypothetical protein
MNVSRDTSYRPPAGMWPAIAMPRPATRRPRRIGIGRGGTIGTVHCGVDANGCGPAITTVRKGRAPAPQARLCQHAAGPCRPFGRAAGRVPQRRAIQRGTPAFTRDHLSRASRGVRSPRIGREASASSRRARSTHRHSERAGRRPPVPKVSTGSRWAQDRRPAYPSLPCQVVMQTSLPSASASTQNAGA